MTADAITEQALGRIFTDARTANGWKDVPVGDDLLHKIYDAMKFGPTSANGCPLRIVFLRTQEAKEKIKPFLLEQNVEKVMTAPVTAIFAYDLKFYDHLPKLFPHTDAKSWFEGNGKLIEETAFRNSSLQAAYFMMAARACGLDCGPMSGFDADAVNRAFFPEGQWKANFICSIGHGDPAKLFPRNPRLGFDEACQVL